MYLGSEEEFRVTVHRDDVTLEMGTIWLPRVEIVRTDSSAVYWEDTRGRVWGVRFLMEGDTLRFISGCSPLSLSPGVTRLSEGARWVPPIPPAEGPRGTPDIDTVHRDTQVTIVCILEFRICPNIVLVAKFTLKFIEKIIFRGF